MIDEEDFLKLRNHEEKEMYIMNKIKALEDNENENG